MTFKRKNKKPEAAFVQRLLPVLRRHGFDVDVVESKAVWSVSARRYLRGNVPIGFSDIVGNNNRGIAVFIEAKAFGKKATLKEEQRDFLIRKIKSGCIGMVVDSVLDFEEQYKQFEDTYYLFSQDQRAERLLKQLPVPKMKSPF